MRAAALAGRGGRKGVNRAMKITRALASFAFLLGLAAACAAQEPQAAPTPVEFPTRLESLMTETGAVVVKGYTRVGSVNGFRGSAYVTALEVTDAPAGHRETGLDIEISDAARPEADAEHAYVDYDEIAPLMKGIDYILRLDNKATKLSRFDARYETRGGLVLETFNTPNGQATAVSTQGGRRARFVLRQGALAEFPPLKGFVCPKPPNLE